jgi:YgiT-type zinc finger domain-containing protein
MAPRRMTLDRRLEGRLVVFEDVPGLVCPDCGEVWLDADVLEAMDAGVREGSAQARTIAVTAVSLASLRAA